jgi:hypothetical protein
MQQQQQQRMSIWNVPGKRHTFCTLVQLRQIFAQQPWIMSAETATHVHTLHTAH